MKTFKMCAAAAALILVSAACGELIDRDPDNPYKALELTTKSVEYARQGNTFAIDFIDRVNTAENGDFIISPLSMQFLLGLLLDGAQGQTAERPP